MVRRPDRDALRSQLSDLILAESGARVEREIQGAPASPSASGSREVFLDHGA